MAFGRLPESTQTLYAELLEQSLVAHAEDTLGPAASGSFVAKEIKGRTYWYLQKSEGARKRQLYLGPESEPLRRWMEGVKAARSTHRPLRTDMDRLCSMLSAGGLPAESPTIIKVLHLLSEARVFHLGGVLIGTVALRAIGNALGVIMRGASLRTQDIDVAHEPALAVGLRDDPAHGSAHDALLSGDQGFLPIPALDAKHPSTSFRIRGRELRVDFLVPMKGRQTTEPVHVPAFGLSAVPLRFLDFLIQSPVQAIAVGPPAVLVNVPQPARFALHKLWTARRRATAFQAKALKDIRQAEALIDVLVEDRPADLHSAWNALDKHPSARKAILASISRLDGVVQSRLKKELEI